MASPNAVSLRSHTHTHTGRSSENAGEIVPDIALTLTALAVRGIGLIATRGFGGTQVRQAPILINELERLILADY
jgi:hypothetical protein